ncbi:two pore calcium channel protein 1-like [Glandiceps talaboti]
MSKKRTVIQVGGQSGTLDNSKTLLIPTIKEETTDDRLTTVETVEHNDNDSSADVNENDKNENCNVPIKKIVFDEKDCEKIEDANDETTKPFKRRSSVENFGKFGLLTPALVLVPGIDGSDTLTQSFKDLQGKNRELKLAAAHIDDAINGRGRYGKARAIFKPKKGQFCFKVLDSQWFSKIVLLAIIVHTCLIFFEPPPVDGTSPAIFVLTVLCLFTYLLDVVLHIVFLTWPVFWSITENRWMRVEFIFLTMFTIDFIMLIVQELIKMRLAQPFRCLRVATLLCKLKNVGHIYDVVLSIAVKLATVFFVIALFILLFGAIGLHLFSMDYHNIGCNATAIVNCTDDPNNIYTGAFDQIGIAALRLFVLLTTENYPDFMLPSYSNNQYSFFYFAIFIFVGVFLLLAIMLAIIVDGYWAFAKKHVKMERSRERAELAKAWNLLDPLGKGMLDKKDDKFLTLFKLLRPKNTDDMNTQLIDFLDGDEDGFIDSFEWTTRLNETLSFEFEEDDSLGQRTLPRCCQVVTDGANRLVNSKIFSICILVLIVVHRWHSSSKFGLNMTLATTDDWISQVVSKIMLATGKASKTDISTKPVDMNRLKLCLELLVKAEECSKS